MQVESYCGFEHLWYKPSAPFRSVTCYLTPLYISKGFFRVPWEVEYCYDCAGTADVNNRASQHLRPKLFSPATAQFWLQFLMVLKSICNFYPTTLTTRNNPLELKCSSLPLLVWFLSQWQGFLSRLGWIRIVLVLDSFCESPRGLQELHSESKQSSDE